MRDKITPLAVGDSVWIHSGWRRQLRPAVVVKIGRTLVYLDEGAGKPVAYYRDGQHQRNGGHNSYFETDAQMTARKRREAAREQLRAAGIEIRLGYDPQWSAEHVEALAAFVGKLQEAP